MPIFFSCFLILFVLFSDSCFPILLCFLISSVLFYDSGCVILPGCFPTSPSLVSELLFLISPNVFRYPIHSVARQVCETPRRVSVFVGGESVRLHMRVWARP